MPGILPLQDFLQCTVWFAIIYHLPDPSRLQDLLDDPRNADRAGDFTLNSSNSTATDNIEANENNTWTCSRTSDKDDTWE